MSLITKSDIEELWSKLGLVGFQIGEVKRYADLCTIPEEGKVLSADEEHLVNTIKAQMKAASDAANLAAGFVLDWVKDHGSELPSVTVSDLRPTTMIPKEDT